MSKLFKKPESQIEQNPKGKFERYYLTENPFPSNPIVNKDSTEKKFNGSIYENSIRQNEYNRFKTPFLDVSQSDPNHLRLGFIIDSSYIGRGNGKSAFLVNLMRRINENYSLDLSNNQNKCFAIYFSPEGGGKTKTFEKFADIFFEAIVNSNIINASLAILRYEALQKIAGFDMAILPTNEDELILKLNDNEFILSIIDKPVLTKQIFQNDNLKSLPKEFPLYENYTYFLNPLATQISFINYYKLLKKEKEKFDFVFTQLIQFFLAAGFNGAYIFIDDFERIPEFQSSIQRKDFATQLRTMQFDGNYLNPKIGFYNMIFALHAGVPKLMQEAWELSGLEQRIPINAKFVPRHNILFEKINEEHASLLIKRYLDEFRIQENFSGDKLYPFTKEVIDIIARNSELNASMILQIANNLIEYASENGIDEINKSVLDKFLTHASGAIAVEEKTKDISTTPTIDLLKRANETE